MIQINLLPDELKLKAKKETQELATKKLFLLFPAVAAVFVCVHLVLGAAYLVRGSQLTILNAQWSRLEPQRKQVEGARKELEGKQLDSQAARQVLAQRLEWAPKLQALSTHLPRGVWFNEFLFLRGDLTLQCSVVSLAKEEMSLLSAFIEDLKKDLQFSESFERIELGSIQIKTIGIYEVTDFTLSARARQQEQQKKKKVK